MTSFKLALTILALAMIPSLIPAAARAEVIDRGDNHFLLQFQVPLTATPGRALAGVGAVGEWWDSAHTYSGAGSNMSLTLEAGACFCEALPDGTVFEHGRVLAIEPGRSVSLSAPLGPLKAVASRAILVFSWPPLSEGAALAVSFRVEGEGVGAWAEAVDGVMQVQFDRWVAWVQPNGAAKDG